MNHINAKIHETITRMISEIGLLRAEGIDLDSFPKELLDARGLLHRLDDRYTREATRKIPKPKFALGSNVVGAHYGRYLVRGREWCGTEYVYTVAEISDAGEICHMNLRLTESSFAG